MSDKAFNLDLYAKVKTDLTDAKDQIAKLKQALDQLEIPKDSTKEFEKVFKQLTEHTREFEALASKGINSLSDSKKATKSWGKIQDLISRTGFQIKELSEKTDGIFPKGVTDNIAKANAALEKYEKKIKDIAKTDQYRQVKQDLGAAQTKVRDAKNRKSSREITYNKEKATYKGKKAYYESTALPQYRQDQARLQALEKELEQITKQGKEADKVLEKLRNRKVITNKNEKQDNYIRRINKVKSTLAASPEPDEQAYQEQLKQDKKRLSALKGQRTKKQNKLDAYVKEHPKAAKGKDKEYDRLADSAKEAADAFDTLNKAIANFEKGHADALAERKALLDELKQAEEDDILLQTAKEQKESAAAKAKAVKDERTQIDGRNKEFESTTKALNNSKEAFEAAARDLDNYTREIEEAQKEQQNFAQQLEAIKLNATQEEWKKLADTIKEFTGVDVSETVGDFEKIQTVLEQYKLDNLEKIPEILDRIQSEMSATEGPAQKVGEGIGEIGDQAEELTRVQQETEHLKQQVLDFLSISNAIQLFKDAVRDAFKTVKELDKAMTETAVVTDFSLSDMWDQLPRYTDTANKLGTTTLGAYETMTLFYQQGLDTNEAFEVGTETMKMARIAGLEYADATNLMTAALRGFNMELSDTSAQRVNDVYSELAAITAADTNEIARAMTKTASIAHSANMEFETTAAFLSQIIETTRESAETAGTAMKTVIARFQELKKNPAEITEVEGEIVDANQIESALRTVGVSLRDAEGQFRNLDDVFLELASKWDTLDRNTQRYIATIAAGSRQQSRFLAMMSNYGRTIELVNAANDSAGASQKQFEKTTASLETALNRLTNAWDEFTMGLANHEIISTAVETLTLLLTIINKISDVLPGAGDGIIKMAMALGSLKLGRAAFDGFLNSMGTVMKESGVSSSEVFGKTFKANLGKEFGGIGRYIKKIFPKDLKTFGFLKKNKANISKTSGIVAELDAKQKELEAAKEAINAELAKYNTKKKRREHVAQYKKAKKDEKQNDSELKSVTKDYEQNKAQLESLRAERARMLNGMTEEEARLVALHQKYGAAAIAAGSFGAVLGGVSKALKASGYDKAAAGLEDLANGAVALGAGLAVIPGILKAIKVTSAAAISTVGMVFAAGVALVSVGKAIADWIETPAEKMARLNEELDEAKQLAEDAQKAFAELGESKDGYKKIQEDLKSLSRGTDEWKQKLVEANEQVLTLLNNYPQLATYITRGENGSLQVSQEGWDVLEKEGRERVTNNQAVASFAQLRILDEERKEQEDRFDSGLRNNRSFRPNEFIDSDSNQKKALLDFYKEASPQDYSGHTLTLEEFKARDAETQRKIWENSKLSKDNPYLFMGKEGELTPEIEEIIEQSGIVEYSDKLYALSDETALTAETISGLRQTVTDYNSYIEKNDKQIAAYTGMLMNNLSAQASESDYTNEVTKGLGVIFSKDALAEVDKRAEELNTDEGIRKRAKNAGFENEVGDLATYQKVYEKMTGQKADGKQQDELAKLIAEADVANEFSSKAEEIINKLDGLSDKEAANKMATLISGEGKDLKLSDLGTLKDTDIEDYAKMFGYIGKDGNADIEAFADAMGYTAKEGKTAAEILLDSWNTVIDEMSKEKEVISKKATGQGLNGSYLEADFLQDTTVGQFESYTNLLLKALGNGGTEAAESFYNNFVKIMSVATPEQQKKILDSLNTFDFDKADAPQAFFKFLKEMGIVLPDDVMKAFTNDLVALGKATRQIDLKSLIEQASSLTKLGKDIKEREPSEGITQEEFEELVSKGLIDSDNFAWDGEKWIQIEGSMDELSKAIKGYTEVLLQQAKDDLQQQIDNGKDFQEKMNAMTAEERSKLSTGEVEDIDLLRKFFGGEGNGKTDAEILTGYQNGYQNWNNLTANQSQMKAYGQQVTDQRFANSTGQEILNSNATNEEKDRALDVLIAKEEGLKKAVDDTAQALANDEKIKDKSARTTKALAADNFNAEKKIANLCKIVEDNNDAFKKGDKSSTEYYKALEKVTQAAKEVFGESINSEFVEGNKALFEQLAEGGTIGEQAFQKIQEAVRQAALESVNSIDSTGTAVSDLQAWLQQADMDFSVNGHADLTDIAQKLYELYGDVDLAKAELEKLTGASVEFSIDYDYVQMPVGLADPTAPKKDGNILYETMKVPRITSVTGKKNTYQGSGFAPSKKGGGGGGKKEEKWENSYDQLYNLTEQINEQMRIREKIERRYDAILKARETTTEALKNNTLEEIDALKTQAALQQEMLLSRKKMMEQFLADNTDMSKYGTYNAEAGVIEIDWGTINSVTDKDEGEKIEKYIGKLEEIQGQIEDTEDALFDIEDRLDEIKTRGKEEYLDLENRIKDAIISARQEEIDKLSAINDSINTTNAKVLDGIQKSVEKMRQDRANEKAEQDLADKQRQLAYLQQDTSGANDLAIMDLQKEIEEGQQSYTDALIDQKITALQEQNDKAAEQRDQQIAILSAQLQRYEESGQIWEEVQNILDSSLNDENSLIHGSVLEEILKKSENWEGMSDLQKMDWLEALEDQVAQGMSYLEVSNSQQDVMNEAMKEALDKIANFKPSTYSVSSNKNSKSGNNSGGGKTYPTSQNTQPKINGYIVSIDHGNFMGSTLEKAREAASNHMFKVYKKMYGSSRPDHALRGMANEAVVKAGYRTYKTGGLADFTGPAWLDGTKSKPEIVLNARDTENFIQLKNVLASLMSHGNTNVLTSENSGDSTYDIDINVESIGSDYDVEQIAEKVESMINSKARYRNNNTINLMR